MNDIIDTMEWLLQSGHIQSYKINEEEQTVYFIPVKTPDYIDFSI